MLQSTWCERSPKIIKNISPIRFQSTDRWAIETGRSHPSCLDGSDPHRPSHPANQTWQLDMVQKWPNLPHGHPLFKNNCEKQTNFHCSCLPQPCMLLASHSPTYLSCFAIALTDIMRLVEWQNLISCCQNLPFPWASHFRPSPRFAPSESSPCPHPLIDVPIHTRCVQFHLPIPKAYGCCTCPSPPEPLYHPLICRSVCQASPNIPWTSWCLKMAGKKTRRFWSVLKPSHGAKSSAIQTGPQTLSLGQFHSPRVGCFPPLLVKAHAMTSNVIILEVTKIRGRIGPFEAPLSFTQQLKTDPSPTHLGHFGQVMWILVWMFHDFFQHFVMRWRNVPLNQGFFGHLPRLLAVLIETWARLPQTLANLRRFFRPNAEKIAQPKKGTTTKCERHWQIFF